MKFLRVYFSFIFLSILLSSFDQISKGLFVQNFNVNNNGKDVKIAIIKISPDIYSIEIYNNKNKSLSLKDIADKEGYTILCNAGMFDIDYKSSMGFLKNKGTVMNPRNHPNYYSALAFDPINKGISDFYIYDLDLYSLDSINNDYNSIIQNLRLIKRSRENRWPKQDKEWKELAIGQDIKGNIILIYCHSYISMHYLNEILLDLPIDLETAQHLEGNMLAQLFLKTDSTEIDYDYGQYVPNLIGFRLK